MMSPTPRQAELLRFIEAHTVQHGMAPTYVQMAEHLGLKSRGCVNYLVKGLEERGLIRRLPNQARAIEVIARSQSAFFDTLNPTTRYVIQSIATKEGTTPETVMREWLNDWTCELRRERQEKAA